MAIRSSTSSLPLPDFFLVPRLNRVLLPLHRGWRSWAEGWCCEEFHIRICQRGGRLGGRMCGGGGFVRFVFVAPLIFQYVLKSLTTVFFFFCSSSNNNRLFMGVLIYRGQKRVLGFVNVVKTSYNSQAFSFSQERMFLLQYNSHFSFFLFLSF